MAPISKEVGASGNHSREGGMIDFIMFLIALILAPVAIIATAVCLLLIAALYYAGNEDK